MNPYEILEISVGASPDEIKAAYHALAKKWHPDRYTGALKVEAEQRFRMLAEAYNMVKGSQAGADRPAPSPAVAPDPPGPAAGSEPIRIEMNADRPQQIRSAEEWFKEAQAAEAAKSYEKALGLVQYAIRMDGERGEFHALLGKLLDETDGDKRALVHALEAAIRLNSRDVESTILLAKTFQFLGMHARASRLWNVVRNLAPNHPIFAPAGGKAGGGKGEAAVPMGEQFSALVANAKLAVSRIFKRG